MSEQYTETVVIIRPSFKKITAKEEKTDACRAALFNHFLYWIARKAKGLTEEQIQNGEFSWYATEDQITTDGLGEAWCKKKVSKEIDILVKDGFIGRRRNTANKWDQTRHYYLSEKEGAKIKEHCINEGICLNHLGLPPCVVQLLESLNAIGQYSIWKCQICRMSNGKCTTAIPKVSTKVSTKIIETYDADASLPHVFSDDELLALLRERGYSVINQPELSTPIVDKSSTDPLATSNPIANDTPQPTQNENGSQSELIARPEKPEMPPTSMKLSAEKIVQITEALRGKYYPPEQRAKNKAAAAKIIAKNVNEEQYITAYQDRNDEWWKSTKGPLHVVHMAGKTTNGEMRVLEVLEQVQERISSKVVQFPGRARSAGPVDSSYHPELETDADRAVRDAKNQANEDKLTRRMEAKEQRKREEQARLRERRAN